MLSTCVVCVLYVINILYLINILTSTSTYTCKYLYAPFMMYKERDMYISSTHIHEYIQVWWIFWTSICAAQILPASKPLSVHAKQRDTPSSKMLCSTLCSNMPTHTARLLRQVHWRHTLHCMLRCVAVHVAVLQCGAVCCSVLRCAAVYYSVCVAVYHSVLQRIIVCCTTLQSVAHPPTSDIASKEPYISSKEPYWTATVQPARSLSYTHTLSLSLVLSLTHTHSPKMRCTRLVEIPQEKIHSYFLYRYGQLGLGDVKFRKKSFFKKVCSLAHV